MKKTTICTLVLAAATALATQGCVPNKKLSTWNSRLDTAKNMYSSVEYDKNMNDRAGFIGEQVRQLNELEKEVKRGNMIYVFDRQTNMLKEIDALRKQYQSLLN